MTHYKLVPWSTQDPRAPSDLTGWAHVPIEVPQLDPIELEKRLRDITPDFSTDSKTKHALAIRLRDELIAEGGRPTRTVRTFEPSQADPETVALYDVEAGLDELYYDEQRYWDEELESWRGFLKHRKTNCRDTDQTRIFVEYLAYQEEKIKKFDRRQVLLKEAGLPLDSKYRRVVLEDRLISIQQQLVEIRQEKEKERQHTNQSNDNVQSVTTIDQKRRRFGTIRRSSRLAEKSAKTKKQALQSSALPISGVSSRITKKYNKTSTKRSRTEMILPRTSASPSRRSRRLTDLRSR